MLHPKKSRTKKFFFVYVPKTTTVALIAESRHSKINAIADRMFEIQIMKVPLRTRANFFSTFFDKGMSRPVEFSF